MPSLRSLLLSAQGVLAISGLTSPVLRSTALTGASEVCSNPQLSCHNTTVVENLCCFNAPGGSLLQTQFWDTDPSTGPEDSWTIHGLWPDHCDGTYSQFCGQKYHNISAILTSFGDSSLLIYMRKYWVSDSGSDESFWEHEYNKHATCISTLQPHCYTDYKPTEQVADFFNRVVSLFKTLPTYTWLSDAGITPSNSKTYTSAEIQAALSKQHGGKDVYLGCSDGALDQVYYYFNVRGSVQTGTFVPAENTGGTSCPATGIKYPPKSSSSSNTVSPTSTVPAPTSTGGGTPFSGKGYLHLRTSNGKRNGCIISLGTWYTSGTCATFTASNVTTADSSHSTARAKGFHLKSSKGKCAISASDGTLTCAASVKEASTFESDEDGRLTYDDKSVFYADSVSKGRRQEKVYTGSGDPGGRHEVELSIEWHGI